ncbi:unnamed protein product [Merluccius merluccius]
MTNTDSTPTLPSSPAEASLAKLAVALPTNTTDGTAVDKSPTTSDIASASDSLASTGTSLAETTTTTTKTKTATSAAVESLLPSLAVSSDGDLTVDRVQKSSSPAVLNFKGISVTLENNSVWKQFHSYGTEMILTKSGRRMFPYCRYRLSGLIPTQRYSLVLSIVPADQYKYRWNAKKWEVIGVAEHQAQGLSRAFPHQNSPCLGSDWMNTLVSFYKLKLTNNMNDQDGHMILHSMHRYIPRLHVIPVLAGDGPTPDQPVIKGPESMTFTFPQTEFVSVTTYQNPWIIQLKINHNPFAKGFREEGVHPRIIKQKSGDSEGTKDAQSPVTKPAGNSSSMEISSEKTVSPRMKKPTASALLCDALESESHTEGARGRKPDVSKKAKEVVSKERSTPTPSPDPTPPPKRPRGRPRKRLRLNMSPTRQPPPAPPRNMETRSSWAEVVAEESDEDYLSTPTNLRRKKRANKKWGNSRGREGKLGATVTAVSSPALAVTMQPESDDVEGLLFVSFTSKEALGLHVGDRPTGNIGRSSAHESPVSLMMTSAQSVGLKLNSLDPSKAIDLNYLGVHLPLPPPDLPGRGNTTPLSPTVGGSAFVSRTGKTSDLTKIKGWRDKFIKRSKDPSALSQQGESQKDLSAFCSNMLDEYLESEAQQISERAAAFSTSPVGSVAYQLPEKSSSYVKTLDSALKHRSPAAHNRPCPLSHKPLLYSALTSPAPPLTLDKPGATPKSKSPKSKSPKSKSPRSKPAAPKAGQDKPGPGWVQLQASLQNKGLTKLQLRMLSMEATSENRGAGRTCLTTDRVDFALSALLTATYKTTAGPDCGQVYCRLGCVCSSLARLNRGPLHCRRPDCMLGCDCFKRKITKQLLGTEDEEPMETQSHPLYSVTSLQHESQPSPGAHWDRIWHKHSAPPDPEPLFAPKIVDGTNDLLQSHLRRTILEKDKDPVYRYLESLMTCARIRMFKPPAKDPAKDPPKDIGYSRAPPAQRSPAPVPVLHTQPKKPNISAKKFPNIILTFKNTGNNSTVDKDSLDSTQIEILSECHWVEDRKLILGALCQRMKRGLATPFCAGPYHVSLIGKVLRPNDKGSTISYKMRICRPKAASEHSDEEDGEDTSDEEEIDENDSDEGEIRSSSEEQGEERQTATEPPYASETVQIGVTPFLSRVLPAGFLQAKRKPRGRTAVGLVQVRHRRGQGSGWAVNGKSYPRACLMLGNVGSLHPANRLAAYVTGRLPAANQPRKPPVASPKGNMRPTQGVKTASKLKAKAGIESDGAGHTHSSPASQPIKSVTTSLRGAMRPACSTSYSSPVSITVSRSLKKPSFLAQSGTYSFRICPPVANQGPAGTNGSTRHPAGVTLPGGFTLIQLPKHGANGALALPVDLDKFPTAVSLGEAPAGRIALGPGPSPKLVRDKKRQLEDGDDSSLRNKLTTRPESELDRPPEEGEVPEDETSEEGSSDSNGEEDGDRVSSNHVTAIHFPPQQTQPPCVHEDALSGQRRRQHKVLERLRRLEQRDLFAKLQTLLHTDPKAPKLRLLSQAQSEIETLVQTSHSLEKQKRKLSHMQKLYIRQISFLAGKPEDLIRRKLIEVYQRKQLLLGRKNFFKVNQPNIRRNLPPIRLPQPPPAALSPALSFAPPQNPRPKDLGPIATPLAAPTSARGCSPRSQPKDLPQVPAKRTRDRVVPGAASGSGPASECAGAAPASGSAGTAPSSGSAGTAQASGSAGIAQATGSTEAAPASGSAGEQPSPAGHQAMTLPLIRTKTGRIILPSSLKPLGQGFYTITILEPDKEKAANAEPGEVIMPVLSDPNSSTDDASKQAAGSSKDGVSGGEEPPNSSAPGGDKTAASPSPALSGPRKSMSPLVEIARLNKSISTLSPGKPLLLRKDGASENNGASRLSFGSCSLVYVPLAQEPAAAKPAQGSLEPAEHSPSAPRRRPGRPRKHPLTKPATRNRRDRVSEESREAAAAAEAAAAEAAAAKAAKAAAAAAGSSNKTGKAGNKRGRGRPRKKGSLEDEYRAGSSPEAKRRTPGNQGRCRPARDAWKSPGEGARSTRTASSPNTDQEGRKGSGKRPLTRGALGKDFPSAKRRSWIDVEKQLGLE